MTIDEQKDTDYSVVERSRRLSMPISVEVAQHFPF